MASSYSADDVLNPDELVELCSEQLHEFGLREVDRIHGEMKGIMKKVGFKGSLKEDFKRSLERKPQGSL